MKHPTRKALRTAVQTFIGLCALAPILTTELGLSANKLPWLAVPLAIAAAVTRVMNTPKVEAFLQQRMGWLASTPPEE